MVKKSFSRLANFKGMSRFALLILLVAATSAEFECPEDTPGLFPDPEDCRSFYEGGLGTINMLDDFLT